MHRVAKASGLRRCVRRGCGAAQLFLENFSRVVTLGEASHGGFSQCNAGADVVQAHMWCVVALGEAKRDYFSHAMLVQMWCRRTCGLGSQWTSIEK